VGDPANVVKVAINVQWTLGSKDIADDVGFVGARCRSSQHCANGAADNLTFLHFGFMTPIAPTICPKLARSSRFMDPNYNQPGD
jgi:hypothetical protein